MAQPGTSQSQAPDWRFLTPISVNNQPWLSTIESLRFDPYEELVWIGTSTGKVSGYLPSNPCARYTSFIVSKIHGVHSVEPTETLVFSLTDTFLRASTKQGLPVARYQSASMTKLCASCLMPNSHTFLLGGRQQKLIQYDYVKEKEIRTTDLTENGATRIRYNGTNIFSADDAGNIHVKSPKNCETIQTMNVFGEAVLDFDVQGSKLVCCGVSKVRHNDTYLKIYDLRMFKALQPIGLPLQPRFVRFMPSYCERICATYQVMTPPNVPREWAHPGGMRMFDLNSQSNSCSFPFDAPPISSFDFSTSKHFVAVGNQCGVINMFADRDHPVVNEASKETVFAAPPVQPPVSFAIDDYKQTFGAIPMAFPTEALVSDWPFDATRIVYRRRKPVGEHENAKQVHYATQIKNPRNNTKLRRHNIVPYILELEDPEPAAVDDDAAEAEQLGVDLSQQPLPAKIRVSRLYRKPPPPLKQAHGYVDTRAGQYVWNLMRHITMESTFSMNLLANAVVHVVYSLSPLRAIVLRHICVDDSCITCELRFLLTAFESKMAKTTFTTTNLAWAMARNGVSLKTGGVLPVLQHIIRKTIADIGRRDSDATIGSKLDLNQRCVRCGAFQAVEPTTLDLITLNYTTIPSAKHQVPFCQLVEKTLHLGATREERECEDCKLVVKMECKRKVRELAPLLLIDTNASAEGFVEFWRRQLCVFERKPSVARLGMVPESPAEKKNCRFGAQCTKKKTCNFLHGAPAPIDWPGEQAKLLEDVDSPGWKHYLPSRIAAQLCEGVVRLSDISNLPDYDEPTAQIYELEAMIDAVGNGEPVATWTHPVVLLHESPVASTRWTLINEQLVSRLHDHEARHLDTRWKLPSLLAYKRKRFEVTSEVASIAEDLFFLEENVAANGVESHAVKSPEELPKSGEMVGLDAEFIKIKTDMMEFNGRSVTMRFVGRASCVDAAGERIIFDDHVRLPDDVTVTDYLTKYSGIVESDLVASKSNKYLTSHKRLLFRMHVLLQRGVVFVGHALHNDFAVLNIHVAEPQIIDTVYLMKLESERLLSLQTLARDILGEHIQDGTHDSVIDARYALKVYRKYLEIRETGHLEAELKKIYARGSSACPSPNYHSASPLNVSTIRKSPEDKAASESAPKSV